MKKLWLLWFLVPVLSAFGWSYQPPPVSPTPSPTPPPRLGPVTDAGLAFWLGTSPPRGFADINSSSRVSGTISVPKPFLLSSGVVYYKGSGSLSLTWSFTNSGSVLLSTMDGRFQGSSTPFIDSQNSSLGTAASTLPALDSTLDLSLSTLYVSGIFFDTSTDRQSIPLFSDNTAPTFSLLGTPLGWSSGAGSFRVSNLSDARDSGQSGVGLDTLQYSVNGGSWVVGKKGNGLSIGRGIEEYSRNIESRKRKVQG